LRLIDDGPGSVYSARFSRVFVDRIDAQDDGRHGADYLRDDAPGERDPRRAGLLFSFLGRLLGDPSAGE
jgi:hypothetical protein